MVETGHFALVLAFALTVGGPVALTGFVLIDLSFTALTMAYVQSDFSVANVWENSHSLKPMLFKVTGTWGNHEGSMLLWVLILTFFSALVAVFGGNLPASLRAMCLPSRVGSALLSCCSCLSRQIRLHG